MKVHYISKLVPVLSAKGVASFDLNDGKWIPHLVLDTSQHPEVLEYIRVHQFSRHGDVQTTWGRLAADRQMITLRFDVTKPVKLDFAIGFNLAKFFMTIDQAIRARCVYIQAGSPAAPELNVRGEVVSAEIGATGFEAKWERVLLSHVRNLYKKRGMKTSDALNAARKHIQKWREFGDAPLGEFLNGS